MAKGDIWMPLYIGDYISSTMHLSAEQHGAYLLMLMAAWKMGGKLPLEDDNLVVISRLSLASWVSSKSVLLKFWDKEDDGYTQKRLTSELQRANCFIESRKANGKKGGRPKKITTRLTLAKPLANLVGNLNETPSPSPSQKEESKTLSPNGFDIFWASYPKKVGKGAAEVAWSKAKINGDIEIVLKAIKQARMSQKWKDGYIPYPVKWLKEKRWLDEPDEPQKRKVAL